MRSRPTVRRPLARRIAVALAAGAAMLLLAAPSSADSFSFQFGSGHGKGWHRHHHHHYHHARPHYRHPPSRFRSHVYYAPPPVVVRRTVVVERPAVVPYARSCTSGLWRQGDGSVIEGVACQRPDGSWQLE